MEIWGTKVPFKIRIFIWQMFHDKLHTTEQLKKREWRGDLECPLCGVKEDMNHIMFKCVNSRFVWAVLREPFGWARSPDSLEDFLANWVGRGGRGK
jgi:hypothetical protein